MLAEIRRFASELVCYENRDTNDAVPKDATCGLLDESSLVSIQKLLVDSLVAMERAGAPVFGRSRSGPTKTGVHRQLPSLRSSSDGVLWIAKFAREATLLLRALGTKEELPLAASEGFFGKAKRPPVEEAKRIQQELVSLNLEDIVELLVSFEESATITIDDIRRALRHEVAIRPTCSKGHKLRPARRRNNKCDVCKKKDTSYRCSQKCDYDVCNACWNLNGRGSVLSVTLKALRYREEGHISVYPGVLSLLSMSSPTSSEENGAGRDIEALRSMFPALSKDIARGALEISKGDLQTAIEILLKNQ